MTSDPWDLCVEQKKEKKKCLCINIIYKSGDSAAKTAGVDAAEQADDIISSTDNVKICCPIFTLDIKKEPLNATDWAKIVTATGNGKVSTVSQGQKFTLPENFTDGITVGKKSNCINIFMVPFDTTAFDARTRIGPDGTAVINPSKVSSVTNMGAHEIGHSLGLSDNSTIPSSNLMHCPQPHGNNLTKDQCKKIWQNIDSYPCP